MTGNLVNFVVDPLMRQENLLEAIRNYKAKYGVPLWQYSVGIIVKDGYQLFVPVYKESHPDEIVSIWHFHVSSDIIRQYTLVRSSDNVLLGEYWKYDYFTINALGKRPKSGVSFRNSVQSRANAVTYECQVAYFGIVYEGVYAEMPIDVFCWEVDNGSIPLPPSNPDDGDFPPEIPVENETGDGLGGGGGGTSSGGSGSGGGSSAPLAQAIFRNSNMIDSSWSIIEKMIEKIVDDCMGQNLYNGLIDKLNGQTLSIQFVNEIGSTFHFDGNMSGIKLSLINMESNHLFHEMFHAFQAYQETANTYINSELNLEIEAHYAQFLYLKKLPEFPGSKWSNKYATEPRHEGIALLECFVRENGMLDLDATEADLDRCMSAIVDTFRTYPAYSSDSCGYNENRTGLSNFENIINLTKDCGL